MNPRHGQGRGSDNRTCSVEAVCAMDEYKATSLLSLKAAHCPPKLIHGCLTRSCPMPQTTNLHTFLDSHISHHLVVLHPMPQEFLWIIISLCICQVNHHPNLDLLTGSPKGALHRLFALVSRLQNDLWCISFVRRNEITPLVTQGSLVTVQSAP